MRQGQQNRRGRGRTNNNNSSSSTSASNGSNGNHSRKPQNPLSRNYESSGPDVKIRGTAAQIAEKYMTLARDASSSGDFVTAENYLQHAEHYNRIIMAAQAQAATQSPQMGEPSQGLNGHHHRPQPDGMNNYAMRDQPQPMIEQPQPQPPAIVPGMEPQPDVAAVHPAESVVNGAHADAVDPASARAAPEGDVRRRRRRYPAGGAAASRAANAAAEPAAANGNGVDGEGRPTDEALAN
jgi:Domain of unknown function (DUF4167)